MDGTHEDWERKQNTENNRYVGKIHPVRNSSLCCLCVKDQVQNATLETEN